MLKRRSRHAMGIGGLLLCLMFTTLISAGSSLWAQGTDILDISAGATAASGSYAADKDFAGGTAASTATTVTTTGVTNPAPEAVYQNQRYGNFTYTLPGFTSGTTYLVRLHMSEFYWTAAGKREFNVLINGTQVLTNFDIFATAGGEFKAVVEQFNAVANSSGQIVIQFVSVIDNAAISGIETESVTAAEGPYPGPSAPTLPGTVMAENYDTGGQGLGYNVTSVNGSANAYRSDGVDLEAASAPATGNDLGWSAAGQWFRYTVNPSTAGTYTVSFLVASPTAITDAFHLSNLSGTNLSGSVAVPATGGYQTWVTVTANVTLPAGTQTLTLSEDAAGWNIDSLAFATSTATVATPTFSPGAGSYTSSQSVTISDSTSGATIYYTTNNTTPSSTSTKYTGPISVTASETIEAIAELSGDNNSAVATAAYTISTPTVATPTFSPGAGSYTSSQSVTISDATSGATIYYTTNNTTPSSTSTKYTGPISVTASETIEAIAELSGDNNSAVATAAYTISASAEGPYPGPSAPTLPGTVLAANYDTGGQGVAYNVTSVNGTANCGGRTGSVDSEAASAPATGCDLGWTAATQWFRYTVNASTAGSYMVSFLVASPTAISDGFHLSNSSGANLTGSVAVPATGGYQTWVTVTATVALPAGTQTLTLNQDAAGWNIDSIGICVEYHRKPYPGPSALTLPGTVLAENYDTGGQGVAYNVTSTNGTANTYRSQGIDLEAATAPATGNDLGWSASGQWFRYTVNASTAGTYTVSFLVASPTAITDAFHLSNASGTNLSGSVNVPATGGYQTWVTVTATVTLPAGTQTLTVNQDAAGWNIDSMAFANSTPTVATPTFSPGAGSYTGSQSVTISDATSGATIYYTTNNTTPSSTSTKYTGPISVTASETIEGRLPS